MNQPDSQPTGEILVEGETCWRRTQAHRAAVLIDGAAYFGALRSALLKAERSIFIVGWELNSRMQLRGLDSPQDGAPRYLGKLICWLAKRQPQLEVGVLLWDHSMFYAAERQLFPALSFCWNKPDRVQIVLDDDLPLGACHHEKLVVIDDDVAFCGGIDLTLRRWDTAQHRDRDPRRRERGSRKIYRAVHDVQMVVDGEAAAAIGARTRDRWSRVGGRELAQSARGRGNCWPDDVDAQFVDVPVGIMRTLGVEMRGREVREIERAIKAAIARAERCIYLENQYLTATSIADALVARMRENAELEVVTITNQSHQGWLEAEVMGIGRDHFITRFDEPQLRRRIQFLYPVQGESLINVHAKLMIVDDALLHVGSANLNNRSMGFDTECDLMIEAETAAHRRTIAAIRNRLIAEHWGAKVEEIEQAFASQARVAAALAQLNGRSARAVREVPRLSAEPAGQTVLASVGDPERAVTAERFLHDVLGKKRRWRFPRIRPAHR